MERDLELDPRALEALPGGENPSAWGRACTYPTTCSCSSCTLIEVE